MCCAVFRDRRSIHSWDICNEPRNKAVAAQGDEIYKWVNHIAGVIKGIDPNHMVTIGSEGYFGPRQGKHRLLGMQ